VVRRSSFVVRKVPRWPADSATRLSIRGTPRRAVAKGLNALPQEVKHMSKNINVNPGQYKVAGRERMGENLGQEKSKAALAKNRENDVPKRRPNKKKG
jgi:hypothetical protein